MSASSPAPDAAASIRSTVVLLAFTGFLGGSALRICDGLLPRLAQDFHVSPGQAGGVVLWFSVAYGLAQLMFGPLGDRYGKAPMIRLAIFGCAAAALACTLAGDFVQLQVLRTAWGVGAAGLIPLAMAWVGDAVPYAQRQATLSRLLLGTLSGMTAGQLAGGLFAESVLGWRGAFGLLGLGYLVMGVLLSLALRRQAQAAPPAAGASPQGRPDFVGQLASVLAVPWARAVLACAFIEGAFLLGPLAYLPTYLHHRFELRLSSAAALVAGYAIGGLLYAMFAPHIVRRLGERRMVAWGTAVVGLGFAALWALPLPLLAAPASLVLGFGTYLFHNTLQTHATQMAPHARGSAVACFAFCLFTGQALGVSLAGLAFDHAGAAVLLGLPAVVLPAMGWAFARALQRRSA